MTDYLTTQERQDIDSELHLLAALAYGMNLGAIWCQTKPAASLPWRKSAFLYILRNLLEQNKVKIGRGGGIVDGSAEEICRLFDLAWPSWQEFDDDEFVTVLPYQIAGDSSWRTHYWTPGDAVWIDSSGAESWSIDAEIG
ncbi:DUF596 domain-containing protein [Pseudoduganella violacea]|uniref:DUF596 domain-containing protein n=1 Tax=Pseudoduganella violacea TaxID=1715466 RepID=A0A7W5BDT0_9BURK|nr:DUF596 domain-containing protein [Pseudoduganella violacea]MBB3121284.1 hypothetical protein [Pseudoduganella violacea]